MANKNSQFAPNADGLGWCPNRKNATRGDIGINKADRGNDAIRFQSRADLKAEFDITKDNFCSLSAHMITSLNQALNSLRVSLSSTGVLKQDESIVAMGNIETTDSDLSKHSGITITLDPSNPLLTQQDKDNIRHINSEISKDCLWVNRKDNGKNGTSLGYHVLKIIKTSAITNLFDAGYGVPVTANNLEDSSSLDVIFFASWPASPPP